MKRIDRVIVSEIFGPWLFGVAIFTVLVMAGSFLFTFTDFVAKGVNVGTVLWMIILLLPGILATTFPMAMLLATLLAFGRLSGESEITAMRAAGTSLVRIMLPVGIFGAAVAIGAFCFGEFVVPPASKQAAIMKEKVGRQLEGASLRPTSYAITQKDIVNGQPKTRLTTWIVATDFDIGARVLRNAEITVYDKEQKPTFILFADQLEYQGQDDWKITGKSKLLSVDGMYFAELDEKGAWPEQISKPTFSPQDIFNQNLKDMNALSMSQIAKTVETAKGNPNIIQKQVYNLEKGYWDKIAFPLAALVYALLGAPLGIRNHRAGGAAGFTFAVLIIFLYYMLTNVLFIAGQGGGFPAFAASFIPVGLGLAGACLAIYLKNR